MDKSTKFREDVGSRVKRLREHLDMRQEDIGLIIGMVGTGVSNIEQGIRGLDPEDALRLKRGTGVPLDWIYAGESARLPKDMFGPLTAAEAPPPAKLRKPRIEAPGAPTEPARRKKGGK